MEGWRCPHYDNVVYTMFMFGTTLMSQSEILQCIYTCRLQRVVAFGAASGVGFVEQQSRDKIVQHVRVFQHQRLVCQIASGKRQAR